MTRGPIPTDVAGQLDALSNQLARRLLANSRNVFAIAEWASGTDGIAWPWLQMMDKTEAGQVSQMAIWPLLDAISLRMSAAGLWCVLDTKDALVPRATLHASTSSPFRVANKRHTRAASSPDLRALERELGELVVRGDESEICRLISLLESEFAWVGFYIRSQDLLAFGRLLRYCESVFTAVDGRVRMDRTQRKEIKAWKQAKIPLQGAFRVVA